MNMLMFQSNKFVCCELDVLREQNYFEVHMGIRFIRFILELRHTFKTGRLIYFLNDCVSMMEEHLRISLSCMYKRGTKFLTILFST